MKQKEKNFLYILIYEDKVKVHIYYQFNFFKTVKFDAFYFLFDEIYDFVIYSNFSDNMIYTCSLLPCSLLYI